MEKTFETCLIKPTLNCSCQDRHRNRALTYTQPPEIETSYPIAKDTYWRAYDRCDVCQHYFAVHDYDMAQFYEGDYVESTYGSLESLNRTFKRIMGLPPEGSDNFHRVNRVNDKSCEHFAVTPKEFPNHRLLDVGSGLGVFPYAMAKSGWDTVALDPDPIASQHMEEYLGLSVMRADFLKAAPETFGRYSLITINKVLEHVEDPMAFLKKTAACLTSEGLIYIEVPDEAALRDPEGQDREEFLIEHLHVFSPASLAILIDQSELHAIEISRMREPSGKYTVYAFCSPQVELK